MIPAIQNPRQGRLWAAHGNVEQDRSDSRDPAGGQRPEHPARSRQFEQNQLRAESDAGARTQQQSPRGRTRIRCSLRLRDHPDRREPDSQPRCGQRSGPAGMEQSKSTGMRAVSRPVRAAVSPIAPIASAR